MRKYLAKLDLNKMRRNVYNNAINSCIEDLKTEILSFMTVSYDFFILPLASGLMKGSRLALIETSKIFSTVYRPGKLALLHP